MYAAGYSHADFWKARSGKNITLWDMYKFNDGDVTIIEYDEHSTDPRNNLIQYVTDDILNEVGTKSQQRSGLVNGMNPDNDKPKYRTHSIGLAVGAMRSFIPQQGSHLFAGGNETVLRTIK
jgi:hypothetical protein